MIARIGRPLTSLHRSNARCYAFGLVLIAISSAITAAPGQLPKNTVLATIPVGKLSESGIVSPDSTTLYVSNSASDTVSVIDTTSQTVTFTIAVGRFPNGLAISTDGKTLYVVNIADDHISLVDTGSKTVTGTVAIGPSPSRIAESPDGTLLYVTYNFGIAIVSTSSNKVSRRIHLGIRSQPLTPIFDPVGTFAYVLSVVFERNVSKDGLLRINTKTENLRKLLGGNLINADGLAFTPSGTKLYFAVWDYTSAFVKVFDPSQNKVVHDIPLPTGTLGAGLPAITPDGKYLYYPVETSVVMIDTTTDLVAGNSINVQYPNAVVIAPNGKYAYAINGTTPNYPGGTVSVIDITPQ
jgi:YVTN family beta-propeller protein